MERIKILSVGENYKIIQSFRDEFQNFDEVYAITQTDFRGFHDANVMYDILLFSFNTASLKAIQELYRKAVFKNEPPILLFCDRSVNDYHVSLVPFKNKLVFKGSIEFDEFKYNISIILKKAELETKIRDFETRVTDLDGEIDTLKRELDLNRLNISKLSQTNTSLLVATFKEVTLKRKLVLELEEVRHENEMNKVNLADIVNENEAIKINMDELSATNQHLISATWRERDLKKHLKEALDDLQKSKTIVEKQAKKIEESINYSWKIQHAILPKEKLVKEDLPESFILYKPKDVVSGDFPYYLKDGGTIYFACVDCTGHGVPGAMLSIIGYLTLNDILDKHENKSPADVLNELHAKVVKTLQQDVPENDASDGMDIGLCKINLAENTLEFAGAHRSLLLIRNGKLKEYKANRLPIGGMQYKRKNGFDNHVIDIQKGDSIFVFSDGYQDQFGGPRKTKYSSLAIQEFLVAHNHLEMEQIKMSLENEFEHWRGMEKQLDDVLFIGVRF